VTGSRAWPKQPSLRFFNVTSRIFEDSVWDLLGDGYLERADLFAFEENVLKGSHRRQAHSKVLERHFHMYTGQEIDRDRLSVGYQTVAIEHQAGFTEAVDRFFEPYEKESIGVHLSGGVDSSLVIGCLRRLGIKYVLVGVTTSRYEFRTERFVQEKLLSESGRGTLIDHEECLPFSGLKVVPPHQVPELVLTGYQISKKLTQEAKRLGVTLLLTGSGGDLLLGGNAMSGSPPWDIAMFNDWWTQDVISSPEGIRSVAFYSDPAIASSIRTLRYGQGEDLRKCWARHYFKDFLPRELVDYTYKSDFWGVYMDGLQENKKNLMSLEEEALDLSGMEYFRRNSIKPLLGVANTECEMEINQRIEARVCAAAWVVSIKRDR
jgi:hypothetical protein